MDSNFRFRATASSLIAIGGCAPENRFAHDSLVEGDGFEPSVPGTKEPVFVAEGELRGPNGGSQKGLFLMRYRWFESISLQRRVSEPSVPPNKFLRGFRHDRSPDLDGRRRGETLTPRWVQDLDSDRRRADPSRHCARAVILA